MQRPLLSCFSFVAVVLLFGTFSDSGFLVYLRPGPHANPSSSHLDIRTAYQPPQQACRHLASLLSQDIVSFPGSAEYSTGTQASWNGYNREFSPVCIVFPRETAHVQIAMKVIFENEINYAVRAGGHSAMKGWNTVQNGILIQFTYMNSATYDAQRESITLQPGMRWSEAMEALEPFGVAPVGSRVNDVGSGFLLGGGHSFLSPRYGFGCDTFIELDVVLVNGTLVTATADNTYQDLFKALKGGANRFGVVTRYELKAVKSGRKDDKQWFGGIVFYANTSAEGMLKAIVEFTRENQDPDAAILPYIAHVVSPDPSHSITTLPVVNIFYNGAPRNLSQFETEDTFNKTFASFLSLPSVQSSLSRLSYFEVASLNAETPAMQGLGQFFGAASFGSVADETAKYIQSFEAARKFSNKYRHILYSTVLAFTPIREVQINIGGNLFVSPGTRPFNAVHLQVSIKHPEQDKGLVFGEMLEDRLELLTSFPVEAGVPLDMNECDKKQRVFETYSGYEELKRIYTKYDPTRFNMRHTDGPIGL